MQQVHLMDYMRILYRRKWLIIFFFAGVVSIVTFFSVRMTPVFRSSAQIILDSPVPLVPVGEKIQGSSGRNEDYLMTQYNMLRSRGLAYKVIEELELWKLFQPFAEDKSEVPVSPMMVNWYLANLGIAPVRGSNLVNVSFSGPNPEILPKIVMAHTSAFIEASISNRKKSAENAFSWIKTQLNAQEIKVEKSQNALYQYAKENNIISLEGKDNIISQKLIELNSLLSGARSERMTKQTVYEQLQSFSINKEDFFSLPEIKRDPVLQSLRTQHATLKAQKLEMAARFGPKHPKMIELSSGIDQLQKDIAAEVTRLRNAIKVDLDRAISLEKSFEQSLEDHKQLALSQSEKAIEYDVLKRQVESDQRLYDMLLQQAKEVSLLSLMDSNNIRVVDPAEKPLFPIRPRISLNIMLAMVLGIFMGTGLAFFVEYLDNTVKTPEEVFSHLGLPVMGMLPYFRKQKKSPLLISWNNNEIKTANLKKFRRDYDFSFRLPSGLQLMDAGSTGRVIMIGSATKGEGKTTVVANLGTNLSTEGLRVLMVDLDTICPNLHNLFDIKNNGGISQVLYQILNHKLEQGSLSHYTIDDIFFLLQIQKRSCRLTIENSDGQTMMVYFQTGKMVHIINMNNPPSNLLGSMLLKGGHITEPQLDDALERHNRTGQPLGYILLNSGYISRKNLQGPLRLQTEDHLQKIFTWKHGQFRVEQSHIEKNDSEKIFFDEDFSSTISRLGHLNGNHFLEEKLFSKIQTISGKSIQILPAGSKRNIVKSTSNIVLLKKLFDILKKRFDIVLLDTPPVFGAEDGVLIGNLADGFIMVIKSGHLSSKVLSEAKNVLSNSRIIGTVINQTRIKQNYYNYY